MGKIVVESVGPMASLLFEKVTIWQEDNSWVITDARTDFNFLEIDNLSDSDPNAVYFSLTLANLLEVDISGTDTYIEADISITYGTGSGRRLLGVVTTDLVPGWLTVGRNFQLFPTPCEAPFTEP